MPDGGRPIRVLVLTAPVGEGHLAAARALAEDLVRRNPSAEVTVRDVLAEFPAPLRWFLNDAYRWQLTTAPWLFGLLFGTLRRSRLLRWLARAALSLAGSRAVLRLVRRDPPDVVVSTWPPATLILGSLRLRGKVLVPACATITDFAGLELWADKGVDLHLVMHESLVPDVERVAGLGSASSRRLRWWLRSSTLRGRLSRLGAHSACRSTGRSSSSPGAAGAWATLRAR